MPRFVVLSADNRFNLETPTPLRAALGRHGRRRRHGRNRPHHGTGIVRPGSGPTRNRDALLLDIDDRKRLELQRTFPGLQVVREGIASMAMLPRTLQPIPTGSMAGAGGVSSRFDIVVTDPKGKRLKGVRVSVITDLSTDPPTGAQATTNTEGVARVPIPARMKIALVLAESETRYWPSTWSGTNKKRPARLTLVCRPIDLAVPDGLRVLHPAGAATDGAGVTVAVIDGGATHKALDISGGANLVDGEAETAIGDNGVGHGTHVAGIIAARPGAGAPAGLAPGVKLLIYRVYAKGSRNTGSFTVSAAIRRAVDDGADLINLSLVLSGEVTLAEREIKRARAKGVVCIAAAGNTSDSVKFPARFPSTVAVSAIGDRKGWPKETHETDLQPKPKPEKRFKNLGVARFSCHGPEVDFTAPGVGVVSLMPKNSFGVMNGTSMSAPTITGLVARKLALDDDLIRAHRDQARSDGIMKMATAVASSVGLPAEYEGHGLLA